MGLMSIIVVPDTRVILPSRYQEASVAEKRGTIFADADEAYLLVDG